MTPMKKYHKSLLLLNILLCSAAGSGKAQDITGVYDRSHRGDPQGGSGLFVLENHKFVVTFFGGAVTGSWSILKGNIVEFKPASFNERFKVFGRHNKDLGDSSRIFFNGFYDEQTFIGFEQQKAVKPLLTRVFNPSPNCFSFPYVYKFAAVPRQMAFSDRPFEYGQTEKDRPAPRAVYEFSNTEQYNDFVAYYITERNNKRPFYAKIKDNKLYFNEKEAAARRALPKNGEDIEFIRNLAAASQELHSVMYNPFYKECNEDVEKDTLNWKFDASKNAYIDFNNYQQGEEYQHDRQDAFNRMVVVYKFEELKTISRAVKTIAVQEKPLFFVKCREER